MSLTVSVDQEKLDNITFQLHGHHERLNHLLTIIYETKGKELKVFKYLTEEILKLKLELDKLNNLRLIKGNNNNG
jgi:hypothetical protein